MRQKFWRNTITANDEQEEESDHDEDRRDGMNPATDTGPGSLSPLFLRRPALACSIKVMSKLDPPSLYKTVQRPSNYPLVGLPSQR